MSGGDKSVDLLVVIVNYRSAGLTVDCLRSLQPEIADFPETRVVVVENASGDDSVERLNEAIEAEGWTGWVSLVIAPSNGGFAAGNNVALAPALRSSQPPDLIWLLNPDTIVRPGACRELVHFLGRRPDVGLVGSRLETTEGGVHCSAFRFPSILSELDDGIRLRVVSNLLRHQVTCPPISEAEIRTDWVAGASLMIRREVFDAVGLLDEEYFMYFEEVDFCLKAARAGWPCWYVPASKVVHLVGQSSGVTSAKPSTRRRPRYWFDSRRRFFLKNYGRLTTITADMGHALGYASYRLRCLIQRKTVHEPKWMLWDFLRYNLFPMVKR